MLEKNFGLSPVSTGAMFMVEGNNVFLDYIILKDGFVLLSNVSGVSSICSWRMLNFEHFFVAPQLKK